MNFSRSKTLIIASIVVILWLTIGCSKRNKSNYDRLKIGMAYDDVVKMLGKADTCNSTIGIMNCKWGDDKKNITIKFAGNKVIIFSSHGL